MPFESFAKFKFRWILSTVKIFSNVAQEGVAEQALHGTEKDIDFCILQGPAGKDGLPGHPGSRGEIVSLSLFYTDW